MNQGEHEKGGLPGIKGKQEKTQFLEIVETNWY